MGDRGDIPVLDECSCAKVDSIQEITRVERGSRDGRIHGDALLVVVFEASGHFNVPERTKLAIRLTLVLSRRALEMSDPTNRKGDRRLPCRKLRCADSPGRDGPLLGRPSSPGREVV